MTYFTLTHSYMLCRCCLWTVAHSMLMEKICMNMCAPQVAYSPKIFLHTGIGLPLFHLRAARIRLLGQLWQRHHMYHRWWRGGYWQSWRASWRSPATASVLWSDESCQQLPLLTAEFHREMQEVFRSHCHNTAVCVSVCVRGGEHCILNAQLLHLFTCFFI